MLRGFTVFVSAFTAVSAAQAQEAHTSKATIKATISKASVSANTTTPGGRRERAPVLAARTTPEPRSPAVARITRPGAPAGGADVGAMARDSAADRPTDCSVADAYLSGADLAVRTYEAPTSAPRGKRRASWTVAPYVAAVTHCGQLYILQVKSCSGDAWAIDRARLETPNGEVLRVNALRSRHLRDGWTFNLIVAEAPPGAEFSSLKLHLASEDGRVAQPEARDLP